MIHPATDQGGCGSSPPVQPALEGVAFAIAARFYTPNLVPRDSRTAVPQKRALGSALGAVLSLRARVRSIPGDGVTIVWIFAVFLDRAGQCSHPGLMLGAHMSKYTS